MEVDEDDYALAAFASFFNRFFSALAAASSISSAAGAS
jgi:hypothetical protein